MSAKAIEALIGGQSYRLSVSPENEPALRAAVFLVDEQMSRIRATTRAKGQERVAIMAALSLASELLAARKPGGADAQGETDTTFAERLAALSENITDALHSQGLRY
ncbi:MAG: cell division protein ZapA [Candidatus Protistobacter heckmanni]|nr:cell division protein ZapA [Candidatus Protistobacter heckmanni]